MKNITTPALQFTFSILLLFWTGNSLSAQDAPRNFLQTSCGAACLETQLIPKEKWTPFPKYGDRDSWESLPDSLKTFYIKKGEEALGYTWPVLSATLTLQFVRESNRSKYEAEHFERREKLRDLVIAEVIEGKGRFVDEVMNGVWAICEETYWGVPAHLFLQKDSFGLPNIEEPTVDLFAAQTASTLAWTDYLIGDKLDEVSKLIRQRIYVETNRRVFTPLLERDDFWWMGNGEKAVNNWNPWICSSWLSATLLLEKDEKMRIQSVAKATAVLDKFLNIYPEDGACDEGPSYWGRAAASVFDCLELLHSATDGKIDLYSNQLVKDMGAYIYKVHVSGNYFVNFADAPARFTPSHDLVHRYGERIGDAQMIAFGGYLASSNNSFVVDWSLDRVLAGIFNNADLQMAKENGWTPFLRDTWYPDTQVMAARSVPDSDKGLYLAAKGGHNAESHNHNDIGHFLVYVNGNPILVDAGKGTYTAKTFSDERYSIWNNQSAYHNVPVINGMMQKDGREFAAIDVKYKASNSYARFSLDMAKAYPKEAGVVSWKRTLQLNRQKRNITLVEKYKLTKSNGQTSQVFLTPCDVILSEPGEIRLRGRDKNDKPYNLFIIYDFSRFKVSVEEKKLGEDEQDGAIQKVWGDKLNRIVLVDKSTGMSGTWKFLISL
ncbi:heparinase II/III family protein [Flammeovirgaceae bacterium SG7u.111]|nr:heparinase II/III family protein [Flammeovirgaceae bacterium SG7u.132]WPO35190.1 heparinase II/III family protein [Flammeovirgaceae bacterium SG7u.111]